MSDPDSFVCSECGDCCRNFTEDFGVILTNSDIRLLSRYLSISEDEFISEYCNLMAHLLVELGVGVYTIKHRNGECVFLSENRCKVHESKPYQCRKGPFGFFWESATIYPCMNGGGAEGWSSTESDSEFLKLMLGK